jgi:hypothetical protein
MYRFDPKTTSRSVRLFPRLATTNSAGQTLRRCNNNTGRISAAQSVDPAADPSASARADVRARLLRMILDNEQVRRNVQRPSHT